MAINSKMDVPFALPLVRRGRQLTPPPPVVVLEVCNQWCGIEKFDSSRFRSWSRGPFCYVPLSLLI